MLDTLQITNCIGVSQTGDEVLALDRDESLRGRLVGVYVMQFDEESLKELGYEDKLADTVLVYALEHTQSIDATGKAQDAFIDGECAVPIMPYATFEKLLFNE